MGKEILKDAVVKVTGPGMAKQDLSDHFSECTIEQTADEVDVTGFTAAGYREFLVGMRDATFTLTAFQDYVGTSIDAVFNPWFTSGSAGTIEISPHQGSISGTNPSYTATVRCFTFSPIAGGVGDASTTPITLRNSGTLGVVKGTSGTI